MERAQCSPSNIFAGDFFAGCLGRNTFPGVLSRCFDLSAMISLLDAMAVISEIFRVLRAICWGTLYTSFSGSLECNHIVVMF